MSVTLELSAAQVAQLKKAVTPVKKEVPVSQEGGAKRKAKRAGAKKAGAKKATKKTTKKATKKTGKK
jgi:hypothetical protein